MRISYSHLLPSVVLLSLCLLKFDVFHVVLVYIMEKVIKTLSVQLKLSTSFYELSLLFLTRKKTTHTHQKCV